MPNAISRPSRRRGWSESRDNVLAALTNGSSAATWMSPATKTQALAKLKTLYFGIGYPDQWQDYSDLAVDPADALGNLRRVSDRNYRNAVARLGQPVDLNQWYIPPQRVGAHPRVPAERVQLSGRLLQAPKFDAPPTPQTTAPSAPSRTRCQSLRRHAGRGVRHRAPIRRWWTPEDRQRFQDGAEALRLAREELPTIILMDLSMPGVDGWEATRQLKADPQTSDAIVIALTAHALTGDEPLAREVGCDGFIAKPFDLSALADCLEQVMLEGRSALSSLAECSGQAPA